MPDEQHPGKDQPEERRPDERPGEASPRSRQPASPPAPPVQSREDTDNAWGEPPEPDDAERYYRDRPPHWDSD